MATAEPHSSSPQASGTFAGDPFCTRGLREALERLERQIGRFSDVATEEAGSPSIPEPQSEIPNKTGVKRAATQLQPDVHSPPVEPDQMTAVAAERDAHGATTRRMWELVSRVSELESRNAALEAELKEANEQRTAAEQRVQSLAREVEAARAHAAELESQIASLQEALQQHKAAERPSEPDQAVQKQLASLQAELKLIRKERDQLMTRLQREETRLQAAGITIEWAESPSKPKAAGRGRRRSSG